VKGEISSPFIMGWNTSSLRADRDALNADRGRRTHAMKRRVLRVVPEEL
jgi:hypothetical protein